MDPEHYQLELFDHANLRCLALRPAKTGNTHWIGGKFSDYGFQCDDEGARIIYAIDQRDDSIPTIIPGLDIIPVCYGFGTGYSDNGIYVYRVENNQITRMTPKADAIEYSYQDYPDSFERVPVEVAALNVDLSNAADALNYVAIFGLRHLNEQQLSLAVESVREFYENPDEFLPIHELELPIEEFVHELWTPFWQDKPPGVCQNPDCSSSVPLKTVAILSNHPHPEVRIWADNFADCYVQLAFQVCSDCWCITASNQCD